jgi:protein O-GlcNAc transferase
MSDSITPDITALLDEAYTLLTSDQRDLAEALYQRILTLHPDHPQALLMMAVTKNGQGASKEICLDYMDRAIALSSNNAAFHYNKGILLQNFLEMEQAIPCFMTCLELDPDYTDAYYALGVCSEYFKRHTEAMDYHQRVLERNPNHGDSCNSMALRLSEIGRMAEAKEYFQRLIALTPTPALHSNYLLTLNYDTNQTSETLFAAHREWNHLYATPLAAEIKPHTNLANPHKILKIGYVSGDFRAHPVANFLLPSLRNNPRDLLHITCYSSTPEEDPVTKYISELVDSWQVVTRMHGADLAQKIRDDGIDILVDLSGHTGGNRLGVFARKPAPVQVSWIGYFNTTGMDAMDYFISDEVHIPASAEAYFSEKIIRLPDAYIAYAPYASSKKFPLAQRDTTKPILFGSFNNTTKLNDEVLALWAEILRNVPGSSLRLKSAPLGNVEIQEIYVKKFAEHGISSDRLQLRGASSLDALYEEYNEIDIALDPFPFNGGATTCEALWMSLPVITLIGEYAVSRQSATYLTQLGLTELITHTREEYLALAIALSNDRPRLAALHASIRDRMLSSPLCDGARFTGNLANAYRQMWHKWCAGRSTLSFSDQLSYSWNIPHAYAIPPSAS